jgi:hypothetical protein
MVYISIGREEPKQLIQPLNLTPIHALVAIISMTMSLSIKG